MRIDGLISPRVIRGAAGLATCALCWEVFARSGIFPGSLTPTLMDIASATVFQVLNGSIFSHILYTVARVAIGLTIATVIAIPVAFAMGRSRTAEEILKPPLSALMPIPSLAWVPLFILWLGLGNVTTILIVVYAALFPLVYNIWRGVQSINPAWIRAALSMGASRQTVFWRIIFPGSLPHVVTGLRLAYGRAWMGVIGGELLAGTDWGLGRLIFEAKEWLDTATIISAILIIGVIAIISERVFFEVLERRTVMRWGMVRALD